MLDLPRELLFYIKALLFVLTSLAVVAYLWGPDPVPRAEAHVLASQETATYAIIASAALLISLIQNKRATNAKFRKGLRWCDSFLRYIAAYGTFAAAVSLLTTVTGPLTLFQVAAVWVIVVSGLVAAVGSFTALMMRAFE